MKKITLLITLFCFSFGFAQTFTDTGGPYDMQNGNGTDALTCGTVDELTLPLAVTGVGTLGGTNSIASVTLNVTHTWADDIVISLQDPSGTVTVLLIDDKGNQNDGIQVTLQDGGTPLPDGGADGPALMGTFAPDEALAGFDGVDADGTWNLLVCDDAGGDVGQVDDWSITFVPTPTCPNVTGASVDAVGATTADFSWTDNASATLGYEWVVLAPGGDPDVDAAIDSGSTGAGVVTDSAAGLTESTSYEFFVRANCDTGGFSPWTAGVPFSTTPTNDTCSGAIDLGTVAPAASCPGLTTASTSFANEDTEELTGCDGFGNLGLWYSFTAPANGQMEFESGAGSPGIEIYEGTCGALTEVGANCYNNVSGTITGLSGGNTYYAMIWTDNPEVLVEFCLYGKLCATPSATTSVVPACGTNEFFIDVDVTDLGDSGTVTISNDAGVAATAGAGLGITNVGPFPEGTAVVITIEHSSDSDCDLVLGEVNFSCPPANDECATAVSVTQETEIVDAASATATSGTIQGATDSGLEAEACNGFMGNANDDVWYSFQALTANVNITFEIMNFDGVVQLYSGTCGALAVVDCADNSVVTAPIVEEINATGLVVGDTYYVRIYQYTTAATDAGDTFDLKVWSPDTLSTESFENENAFSYFPNPVKNELTLKAQSNIENVSVYNMLGQEVLRTAPNAIESNINMNSLSQGAYFVQVTINNVTETVRIMKQ
ncbi:T9SS type A sorting domain-containing protein [uncultured Psychroserpens sp.]|uniref:T9SS type A sorting domain-containing protein n=1 Tax=uncultured Psychroserpens sp. TaxID=255436 RepID=UPI00260D5BB5|nr:T9SS type A sorting domain-containing protein [uncultured Psychroserpens sp.]